MRVFYPADPVPAEEATLWNSDTAGAEHNFAIGLSRLGHHVCFAGRVADDFHGRKIHQILESEEVDTSELIVDASSRASTGCYFRELLQREPRRVSFYRAESSMSRMGPDDLRDDIFEGASLFHVTGIVPAISESCAKMVDKAFDLANEAEVPISFDTNYRHVLWRKWPEGSDRRILEPLMYRSDILLAGDEDLRQLYKDAYNRELEGLRREMRDRIFVLKQAEKGATLYYEGKELPMPAVPAECVDAVGAGDGFDAGFIHGFLEGWPLEYCMRMGVEIGARAVKVAGDYNGYPYLEDISSISPHSGPKLDPRSLSWICERGKELPGGI